MYGLEATDALSDETLRQLKEAKEADSVLQDVCGKHTKGWLTKRCSLDRTLLLANAQQHQRTKWHCHYGRKNHHTPGFQQRDFGEASSHTPKSAAHKGQSKKNPLLAWHGTGYRDNDREMCEVPAATAHTQARASHPTSGTRTDIDEGRRRHFRSERSVISVTS